MGSALQPCHSPRTRHGHLQKLGNVRTFESIAQLASTCAHPPGSHAAIAPAKVGDKFLSELTAEYPQSRASSMADIFAPFVSNQGWQNASIADFANLVPETYVPRRMCLCDGAGMQSSAGHTFPQRNTFSRSPKSGGKHCKKQGQQSRQCNTCGTRSPTIHSAQNCKNVCQS